MSKIEFNHEALQIEAIDKLNDALRIINDNYNLLESVVIPEDFKDASSFLTIKEEIGNCKTKTNEVIVAIEGINKELDAFINEYEVRSSALPESTLKRRNNGI